MVDPDSATLRPPRILVVDDEPDVETLIQRRFRREIRDGVFSFAFARNGAAALERIRQEGDFDIILSDINMPEMDGLTLLEHLKQYANEMRTIIISAYGDLDNIRTAMNRGAFDFVTKPIDFEDLQRTIRKSVDDLQAFRGLLDKLTAAEALRANMEREFQIGRQIQSGFLPRSIPRIEGWRVDPVFESAREVAGDFYDVFQIEGSDRLGVVVADVCNKGVGAALFMTLARSLLRAIATLHHFCDLSLDQSRLLAEPELHIRLALEFTNNYIARTHAEDSMFATVFFGLLEPSTGALHYACAGHEPPLVVSAGDAAPRWLDVTGPVVGLFPDAEYGVRSIRLEPQEALMAYTDGLTDLMADDCAGAPEQRLLTLIEGRAPADLGAHVAQLVADKTAKQRQPDDVTVLTLFREPCAS